MQSSTLVKKANYVWIDVARVFCACLVVALHSVEVATDSVFWNIIVDCFFSQAVPFFFVVSGFFLGKKMIASSDAFKPAWAFAKDKLILYGAWVLLWLPNLLFIYHTKYPDASVLYFVMLLVRRIFLAGEGVYWYILVMAEAAVVIGVLIRWHKEKLIYVIAVLGLVFRYLYDANVSMPGIRQLNHLFYVIFSWSNNVVMMGIPFMAIGLFMARNIEKCQMKQSVLATVYVLSSGCHILLFFIKFHSIPTNILYPVQAVTLFLICVNAKSTAVSPKMAHVLRDCSAVIYFMHTVFIYAVFDFFFTVNAPIAMKFMGSIGLSLLTYALVRYLEIRPLGWLFGMKFPKKDVSERTAI